MSSDVHTASWRAMGCAVDVVVVDGSPDLLDLANVSIEHLERRWSRFLPDSDISRLNHAAGSTVHIDPATVVLLRAMVDGWRATQGAFDPHCLAPLVGLGYAASWHDPAAVTSLPHGALRRSDLDDLSMDGQLNLPPPRGDVPRCRRDRQGSRGRHRRRTPDRRRARGARWCRSAATSPSAVLRRRKVVGSSALRTRLDPGIEEVGQLDWCVGGVATSGTLRRRWTGRRRSSRCTICSTPRPACRCGTTARSSQSPWSPALRRGPRCGPRPSWCAARRCCGSRRARPRRPQCTYADGSTAVNRRRGRWFAGLRRAAGRPRRR